MATTKNSINVCQYCPFMLLKVVTPIRFLSILLAGVNEDCSENELLQMESHEVARKESPIWLYSEKFIIEPIINEVKDTGITAKLLQTVCGILDVNTFELRNVNVNWFSEIPIKKMIYITCFLLQQFSQPCTVLLRGLFPRAALLAHDCCANAFISLDNANHIRVYANRAIKRNEMITYNYTKTLYVNFPINNKFAGNCDAVFWYICHFRAPMSAKST